MDNRILRLANIRGGRGLIYRTGAVQITNSGGYQERGRSLGAGGGGGALFLLALVKQPTEGGHLFFDSLPIARAPMCLGRIEFSHFQP
jgi:hypothetical protein